ncbi:hypothetical protein SASPL_105053 [Salvia splendens]|uniref:Thioesterase domain-containing protein n=1 Tax=Salvia splendens TaxID=180675 RepID=A0A8X9AB87_SALSN|nr:hypothetical protein SASPL_105053 [Salvia splendens]
MSHLRFPPHKPQAVPSFYEYSILRGVRVDSVRLDSTLYCSFTVSARLTDRTGKLSAGAIASLIDEIGVAAIHKCGKPMDVSVQPLRSSRVIEPLELKEEIKKEGWN